MSPRGADQLPDRGTHRFRGERPPPVALAPDTLEEFLTWVASTRVGEAQEVRDRIAAGRSDGVAEALARELLSLPVRDTGRHLMILAVLGEARLPMSLEPLERLVWTEGSIIVTPDTEEHVESRTPEMLECQLQFDLSPAIRARAVEMLAYLRTQEAEEATLRVVRDHPEAEVRRAAVDAHLYNRGDSPEVLDALRGHVRPDDAGYVNLPRRTGDMDVDAFDARVRELMADDEAPPVPPVSPTLGTARPGLDRQSRTRRSPRHR